MLLFEWFVALFSFKVSLFSSFSSTSSSSSSWWFSLSSIFLRVSFDLRKLSFTDSRWSCEVVWKLNIILLCRSDTLLIFNCFLLFDVANLSVATSSELFSSSSFSEQLFLTNFLDENFTRDRRAFLGTEGSDSSEPDVWNFLLFFIFLIFRSFFNVLTRARTFEANRHVVSLCWFWLERWKFFINWELSREELSVTRMTTCFSSESRAMFLSDWSLLRKARARSRWLLNLRNFRVSNSNLSDRQSHCWRMVRDDCCCSI